MKRLLAFMLALLATTIAQDKKPAPAPPDWPKRPLVPGEVLTYAIRWKGVRAGTATLQIAKTIRKYRNRECLLLISTTRSAEAISAVYEVNDVVKSLVERTTLQPLKFSKRIKEGPHRARHLLFFYPDKKKIRWYRYKNNRYTLTRNFAGTTFPVHDVLSVVFAIRRMDLEIGKTYTIRVCTGKRICKAELAVLERKRLKVEAGEFEALRLGPRFRVQKGKLGAKEGLFVSEEIAEIWVDALTKRPLLMRAKVPIGTAEVELVKYSFPEEKEGEGK